MKRDDIPEMRSSLDGGLEAKMSLAYLGNLDGAHAGAV